MELFQTIQNKKAHNLNVRFTSLSGAFLQTSRRVKTLAKPDIADGVSISGVIDGFCPPEQSDIVLLIDDSHIYTDPFYSTDTDMTIMVFSSVAEARTHKILPLDARECLKRAVQYVTKGDAVNEIRIGADRKFLQHGGVFSDTLINALIMQNIKRFRQIECLPTPQDFHTAFSL